MGGTFFWWWADLLECGFREDAETIAKWAT